MRLTLLLSALLFSACSNAPPTLADEASAVGLACASGPSHSGTGWVCGEPVDGSRVAAYELRSDGYLHFTVCNGINGGSGDTCIVAGEFHFRVEAATLGVHEVDGTSVRASNAFTGGSAVSGEIEILGYDPVRGSLCARYDVVMESGFRARGELSATDVCGR